MNNNNQEQGFTLLELLAALAIIGILSAITTPLVMWANKPLQNATYQAAGIFSQGRSRAIATTSALRIQPDPADPDNALMVEAADTRSCNSRNTELTETVDSDSAQLSVVSAQGFAAGDRLKIGDDETENIVLTTDNNNSALTLGQPLGTTQTNGTAIEILTNWSSDKTFFQEDMKLPSTVTMTSNLTDWVLCFDSRGIATISDASGISSEDLELTLINEGSKKEGKITVFQGGMIDSVVIQPKENITVAATDGTASIEEETAVTPPEDSASGSGTTPSGSETPAETEETVTDPTEPPTEEETTSAPTETPVEEEQAIAPEEELVLEEGVLVAVNNPPEDTDATEEIEEPEEEPEEEEIEEPEPEEEEPEEEESEDEEDTYGGNSVYSDWQAFIEQFFKNQKKNKDKGKGRK